MNDLIIVNLKKKIVLDTSIIIDGDISQKIDSKEIDENFEIIVPRAAIDELQSQACKQKEHGFIGLAELRKIREKSSENNILLRVYGEKPNLEDIKLSKNGRIDAIITEIAEKENATLFTADYIQHLAANATGISSVHIRSPVSASREAASTWWMRSNRSRVRSDASCESRAACSSRETTSIAITATTTAARVPRIPSAMSVPSA